MGRSDMVEPRQLALIHAEIDGELNAEQRAELARCVLADPHVRAVRDDLRRLCTTLDGLVPVEPPAQFRRAFSLHCRNHLSVRASLSSPLALCRRHSGYARGGSAGA